MYKPFSRLVFITVNYNGIEDTRALIHSILSAHLSIDYRIVVVDNASVYDEWSTLSLEFPFILGCRSDVNLGFAGGNNLGLTLVEADYYYFINNDTLLPIEGSKQILSMIDYMESNTTIGGLCPKIKYVNPVNMLQYAGCTTLTRVTLRNKQIGYQELDYGQYEDIISVPYMHGAAMLVRQDVIKVVGPMPEFYFLYYEELDWCEQILKSYKLFYYPKAMILHKESASTGVDSPLKSYYLSRNRLIYAYRNRDGMTRIASIVYLIIVQGLKGIFQLFKGNRKQSWAIVKGLSNGVSWILRAN